MHIFNNKNIAREPSKPFLSVAVATQLGRTVLEFEHSASCPAPPTARSAFEVPVELDKKIMLPQILGLALSAVYLYSVTMCVKGGR